MNTGFLITFYTSQNRSFEGQPINEWLVAVAKQMKLRGATVVGGLEGLDHHGLFHSASFFELADRPIQIQFAVTNEQATELFGQSTDFTLLRKDANRIWFYWTS